jgi:hypothetical protein
LYIVIALAWRKSRRSPAWAQIGMGLGAVIVPMLPYMFIAYQTALPSRQLYLASAVLMTTFAVLLRPLAGSPLLKLFVAVFVAFNIGYLWFRKDRQFEQRAAPTTQLISMLRQHRPEATVIEGFPYPYPDIARSASLAVPGWEESLLSLKGQGPDSGGEAPWCLRWNDGTERYEVVSK